ncbi:hypothetical protein [Mesorhizobium sp.]|uniref:hypothetical protein n=1 Tax=Mesorhizobium sp. TaxID=1871066 RepID=UPI0025F6D5E3|nr:hypothetical protein [Mesorhizobium sp.]
MSDKFQERVQPWMLACFGEEISKDRIERNHRFIEEALELVQANGCTQSEAHQLVDYVFGRPIGDVHQEIGGVLVTLAALCLAIGEDMHKAGETELARVWTKVEKIRAKQAAKPKHSPLPESAPEGLKIIGVDNFGRESVADFLVAGHVANDYVGKVMVDALNAQQGEHGSTFFRLVPSGHRLSRGMADLV